MMGYNGIIKILNKKIFFSGGLTLLKNCPLKPETNNCFFFRPYFYVLGIVRLSVSVFVCQHDQVELRVELMREENYHM